LILIWFNFFSFNFGDGDGGGDGKVAIVDIFNLGSTNVFVGFLILFNVLYDEETFILLLLLLEWWILFEVEMNDGVDVDFDEWEWLLEIGYTTVYVIKW